MKIHHFDNRGQGLNIQCPITGRPFYRNGKYLKRENIHYGIPPILLPPDLLRQALQNQCLWRAWERQKRIILRHQGGLDTHPFEETLVSRRILNPQSTQKPPSGKSMTISEILESPEALTEDFPNLFIDTEYFSEIEKTTLLDAAERTRSTHQHPDQLPDLQGVQLSGVILDVFATRGYDAPLYYTALDDSVYFSYLRHVSDNSLDQALAYFRKLSDQFVVFQILEMNHEEAKDQTNFHLFEEYT